MDYFYFATYYDFRSPITFLVPKCKTLEELLAEYVSLYGKTKWSLSTYSSNTSVIEHYILPRLGSAKLADINTRVIERYYQALHLCDDPRLALALNVAFCCSLRMGEMLVLTWDRIDIAPENIEAGTALVYIDKQLQSISRKIMAELDNKDILLEFPSLHPNTSTVLILKRPKTDSSIRKVFLPKSVAEMLVTWKQAQAEKIELLGGEYHDYDLVFAGAMGLPTEANTINDALHRLIKENDLPPIVFHSLRHSSITYKLKLNGGDIKSVQGDSGHSQVKMVTDVYSHILDDDRKNNAQLFQEAFYDAKTDESESTMKLPDGLTTEKLAKLLENPETASLIGMLAKQL